MAAAGSSMAAWRLGGCLAAGAAMAQLAAIRSYG